MDKDPETLGQEIDLEAGKGYYTPRQAAEMLATDFFEVNRLIRQGALQAVSINRYRWIVAKSLEDMVRLKHGADRLANAPEPQLIRRQEKRVPEETGPGGRLRPMVVRTSHEGAVHAISEPDGNGGKRYAKREVRTPRPREEQIAVPVPAYLLRGLVESARATLATNKGSERKYLTREWELRGLVRCSCGGRMGTQTTKPRGGEITYHYYACNRRRQLRTICGCTQGSLSAVEVEETVWRFVSELLEDPEKVRIGMNRLIEQELSERSGDPQREAEAWTGKIAECDRLRSAYQDQQATGLMTLDELGGKLDELESTREIARAELGKLQRRREHVEELERDRDAVIESYAGMLPEALDALSGEERRRLYGMLRLEVAPTAEGLEVAGALSTSGPRRTAT